MSFHAATLESNRVQKLLSLLRAVREKGATTLQINEACGSTRASSDVSELRANGVAVVCRHDHTTDSGRRVHRFWLEEFAPSDSSSSSSSSSNPTNPPQPTNPTERAEQPEFFAVQREGIL